MKDDPDRAEKGFDRREAFAPAKVLPVNRTPRVMGCIVGSPDSA